MRHLRDTGLIHQCLQMPNGYWRIPYKVAVEISSPEVLVLKQPSAKALSDALSSTPRRRTRRIQSEYDIFRNEPQVIKPDSGRSLSPATTKRPKSRVEILTQPRDDNNLAEHYGQIGKVLRQAGITLDDLVRDYYQNKGVEQQPKDDDTTPEGQTTGELSRDDDDQS